MLPSIISVGFTFHLNINTEFLFAISKGLFTPIMSPCVLDSFVLDRAVQLTDVSNDSSHSEPGPITFKCPANDKQKQLDMMAETDDWISKSPLFHLSKKMNVGVGICIFKMKSTVFQSTEPEMSPKIILFHSTTFRNV